MKEGVYLWNFDGVGLPPLARNSDPLSSFEAAEELVESGRLGKQEQEVLAALKLHPGLSSKRLAETCDLNRYTVARRLPGLRDKGLAKNCSMRDCQKHCDYNDNLCGYAQKLLIALPGEKRKALRWWAR